ncbi:hypothetical protein D3C80_1842520 [compost metagenome]
MAPLPSAVRSPEVTGMTQVRSGCTMAVKDLPPKIRVTVSPAVAPLTVPLRVWPAPTSAMFSTSSLVTGSIFTDGSLLSTSRSAVLLTLLPTALVPLTVTL